MENSEQDNYDPNAFDNRVAIKQRIPTKSPVVIGLEEVNKTLRDYISKVDKIDKVNVAELRKAFDSSLRDVFNGTLNVNISESDFNLGKLFEDSLKRTISENISVYLKSSSDHSESLSQSIADINKELIRGSSREKLAKTAEAAFASTKSDKEKDEGKYKGPTFVDKMVSRIDSESNAGKAAGFLTSDPSDIFFKLLDGVKKKGREVSEDVLDFEKTLSGNLNNTEKPPEVSSAPSKPVKVAESEVSSKVDEDVDEMSAKTVVVNASEVKGQVIDSFTTKADKQPEVESVPVEVAIPEVSKVSDNVGEQQSVTQDIAENTIKTVKLSDETVEALVSGISEKQQRPEVSSKKKDIDAPEDKSKKKDSETDGGGIMSSILGLFSKGGMARSFLPKIGSMAAGAGGMLSSAASAAAPFALPALAISGAGAAGYAAGTYLDAKFDVSGKAAKAADSMGLTDVSAEDKAKTETLENNLRKKKLEIFGTDKPSKAMIAANAMVKRTGGGKFEPKLFKDLQEVDKFEYDGKSYDLQGKPVVEPSETNSNVSSKTDNTIETPSLSETVQQKNVIEEPADVIPIGTNTSNVPSGSVSAKPLESEKSGGNVISITNNDQSVNSGSRSLQYDRDYVYLARDKIRGSMNYSRGLT